MIIPTMTSMLPGMVVGGTLSPSITYANTPANSGIRSEIVDVTTGGNLSDAKAKAKLGIAVQSTARPRNIAKLLPVNVSEENVAGTKHIVPINTALPRTKVRKVTLVGSGATPFFATCL